MRDTNLGPVGARVDIRGEIRVLVREFTPYGTTSHVTLITPAGVLVRWDSSKHMENAIGSDLSIRATVKEYAKGELHDVVVSNGRILEDALLF